MRIQEAYYSCHVHEGTRTSSVKLHVQVICNTLDDINFIQI